MKSFGFLAPFTAFLLIQSSPLFANPDDEVKRVGTTVEVAEEDDRLAKISAIPDIKDLIDELKQKRSKDSPETYTLREADWEELWKKNIEGTELEAKVFEVLNGKTTGRDGTVTENDINHNYDLGNFEKKQTKSLLKLQEYLKERLKKKLFGENPDQTSGVKAVANHNVFHRLYSSQVGKNLMVELANYCIHADPETGMVPYLNGIKDRKKATYYRKLNSETLNQYAANENKSFDACVGKIGSSCDAGKSYPSITVQNRDGTESTPPNFPVFDRLTQDQQNNTAEQKIKIPKPCEISRYMTAVKVTLKQLEEYEEENSKLANNRNSSFQVEIKQKENLDIDSVVNISSGELLNGDGNSFRDAAQAEATEAEQCVMNGTEACESYTVKAEESTSIQDEFNLRNLAMQKKLEKEVLGDDAEPEQIVEFLKKKGMSEASIQSLLAKVKKDNNLRDEQDIEAYKIIIADRFKNERIALRDSLSARLNAKAEADQADSNAVQSKAEEIKKSIEDSPMQLAQVFQYANVVSSFLKVNRGDGSSSTNTAALTAELENPFNTEADPRTPASQPQDLSALEEFASDQPAKDEEQGSAVLGSEEIDKIQFSNFE